MVVKFLASAALAAGVAIAAPAPQATGSSTGRSGMGFNWGGETIRGVNIGGWLISEPFITPSIYQGITNSGVNGVVDEYSMGQILGNSSAYDILKPHWDSWATFADFQKIASAGFNMVRIPIGFWAYDTFGAPYAQGAAPYLDAAIDWARGTGLKVIIDLHGAPGSQNGFDNSGERLTVPGWQQGNTVAQTLQVLQTISDKYAQPSYMDVVVGIELLNEPLGPELNRDQITQFYRDGYGQVRDVSMTTVVLHDAFFQTNTWNGVLTPSDNNAQNVAMDHHDYQVFTDDFVAMQPWQHRQYTCNSYANYYGSDKWSFVGEWTAAMTDCAPALNGYGIGARYDGTYPGSTKVGDCGFQNVIDQWPQSYKDDTRGFIEGQMEVFEKNTQGWVFWNFKTEAAAEWDLFRLLDAGVFPQPITSREFGAICT